MSHTYSRTELKGSFTYLRFQQRERKLQAQQASCTHVHYSFHSNAFGEYAVCLGCDKRLGYRGTQELRDFFQLRASRNGGAS